MKHPAIDYGTMRHSERARHNLPTALAPFVGREAEHAQVRARLHDSACRLLTLVGAGGVGKTRLALEVAAALVADDEPHQRFAHGVWFVSLAALQPSAVLADTVAATIASSLSIGLAGAEAPAAQVADYLREKALLLIIDNCEYLPNIAQFIHQLVQGAPALTVLATSRERLNLPGEWIIALEGLTVALDAHSASTASATKLFVQRAQMLLPSLALTEQNAPAISQICQLVAGLPLGIELAASWTPVLTCAEIAAEITQNLDFLTDTRHAVPTRQHSLRAVFASSMEQLSATEQQVLRRLAVIRSSFTRDAATAIVGATLADLLALLGKSLLYRTPVANSDVRYGMLAPLRQYAIEQLDQAGETEATSAAHASYYLARLAAHAHDLIGPAQHGALQAIDSEIAEIRLAWQWACDRSARDMLLAASDSLFLFYYMRSWFAEGAATFGAASRALATRQIEADDTRAWAKALACEGWFVFHSGRQHAAKQLLEHSLALLRALDQPAELVFTLNYLAAVELYLGDAAQTNALAQEARARATANGDSYSVAVACNILGQAAHARGDYAAAQEWSQQSLAIEQQIGNRWSAAFSFTNLGKAAYAAGAYQQAQLLLEQSLAIRESIADTRGLALCLAQLGDTAVALGEQQQAGARYSQSWALFRDLGNLWGMTAALTNLGQLAANQQRDQVGLRLLAEALRLAIETASFPQILAIFRASVPCIERTGETDWAVQLTQAASATTAPSDSYRPIAERLLAWLAMHGAAKTTLESAISAAQAPPAAPELPAQPSRAQIDTLVTLTARERDVLRLVAQGMSDAEVADRLVVSTRTVSTHLTSIYSKLQVKSRSAATRFAIENGLG